MPFEPGFNLGEALDLLALCAIVENAVTPPIPSNPAGWNLRSPSPEIGPFKNRWQLWQKGTGGPYAIVLRGTVMEDNSILEDLISVMVEAKGSVKVGSLQIDYQFAADSRAGVHLGFALGTLLLLNDPANGVLATLKEKVEAGSDIYLTGHSQGAAMVTLMRSYLQYAQHTAGLPAALSYKTYAFAQPKPGNDHYAEDFESQFCNPEFAFRVTNSLDWVPQVPFTLQFVDDLDEPNPLSGWTAQSVIITEVLAELGKLYDRSRSLVESYARSRLQAVAVELARTCVAPSTAFTPEQLMAVGFDAPILPSLNFVCAGTDKSLVGTPCVGVQCKDALFEHHAATYYALLQATVRNEN